LGSQNGTPEEPALRTGVSALRTYHVVDRENAAIGIFLTLDPPTKPMIEEAVGK
jgi:hypothetical protein